MSIEFIIGAVGTILIQIIGFVAWIMRLRNKIEIHERDIEMIREAAEKNNDFLSNEMKDLKETTHKIEKSITEIVTILKIQEAKGE